MDLKLLPQIQWVEHPEEAELALLPMAWDYYYQQNSKDNAYAWCRRMLQMELPVISVTYGDFGITPEIEGVWVFRPSGYASRRQKRQMSMPFALSDFVMRFQGQPEPIWREYEQVPVISFCGLARNDGYNSLKEIIQTVSRNSLSFLGLRPYDRQAVLSACRLRARALDLLDNTDGLSTSFIRRKEYRAGAVTKEERHQTTKEYYRNLIQSDYVLCVRGGGNFSVRLYETLSMGRIPVYINTDCILPWDDEIDWTKHVVWVEQDQLSNIGAILLAFHDQLDSLSFREMQQSNRRLWKERLSPCGFWGHLLERFAGVRQATRSVATELEAN